MPTLKSGPGIEIGQEKYCSKTKDQEKRKNEKQKHYKWKKISWIIITKRKRVLEKTIKEDRSINETEWEKESKFKSKIKLFKREISEYVDEDKAIMK